MPYRSCWFEAMNEPLPTIDGGFSVILAAPPWRFVTYNSDISAKSAASKYDLMNWHDIAALPIRMLAAKDCALVMWATQAMLPDAVDLMSSWGFRYKTAGAWAKQSSTGQKWAFGTG